MIVLMACRASNNIIGKDGTMPWHVPEELAFFKERTLHHHILMGKRTWNHMPKGLAMRTVHILTHYEDSVKNRQDVIIEKDVASIVSQWANTNEILIVCGGAKVYETFLPYATELWLSKLPQAYEGDTYFPSFDETCYDIKEVIEYPAFAFTCYKKK